MWRYVCNTRTCTQKILYFHVFPEESHLSPSALGKNIMFSGKNTIFPDNTRKIMCRRGPFWKDHLFRKFEENIIFPCIFLWERSSFIFRLRGEIIFSRKRNIIFLDNTGKVMFQRDFFGKVIFSVSLEKENMLFRAVCMTKITLLFLFSAMPLLGRPKITVWERQIFKKKLLRKFRVCVYLT